jgi:hypothetical protein
MRKGQCAIITDVPPCSRIAVAAPAGSVVDRTVCVLPLPNRRGTVVAAPLLALLAALTLEQHVPHRHQKFLVSAMLLREAVSTRAALAFSCAAGIDRRNQLVQLLPCRVERVHLLIAITEAFCRVLLL